MPLEIHKTVGSVIVNSSTPEVFFEIDFGSIKNFDDAYLTSTLYTTPGGSTGFVYIYYSWDNVTWTIYQPTTHYTYSSLYPYYATIGQVAAKQHLYFKVNWISGDECTINSVAAVMYDKEVDGVEHSTPDILHSAGLPCTGEYLPLVELNELLFPHIVNQTNDNSGGGDASPTSTNIVTGSVTKLGAAFQCDVFAFSPGGNPKLLGKTQSSATTGEYTIDVYPHTGEVLVCAVPIIGKEFEPLLTVVDGEIIHPATGLDKFVYQVAGSGQLGITEPAWITEGQVSSGDVILAPIALHRPLINGFLKPVITPV